MMQAQLLDYFSPAELLHGVDPLKTGLQLAELRHNVTYHSYRPASGTAGKYELTKRITLNGACTSTQL